MTKGKGVHGSVRGWGEGRSAFGRPLSSEISSRASINEGILDAYRQGVENDLHVRHGLESLWSHHDLVVQLVSDLVHFICDELSHDARSRKRQTHVSDLSRTETINKYISIHYIYTVHKGFH